MRWVIAGFGLLTAAFVGIGYYGWQTISEQESQIAALTSQVAELEDGQEAINTYLTEQAARPADPAIANAQRQVDRLRLEVDGLRLGLEETRREVGSESPPFTGRTLWRRVDELDDAVAEVALDLGAATGPFWNEIYYRNMTELHEDVDRSADAITQLQSVVDSIIDFLN